MIQLLKIPFNAGTLGGLGLFVVVVLSYYCGLHPMVYGRLLLIPVTVVCLLTTMLYMKKRVLAGKISFRRAFYTGVVTSLVSVSLCCILTYLFILLWAHSFVADYLIQVEQLMDWMKSFGLPVSNSKGMMDEAREKLSPAMLAQGMFLDGLFFSMLASVLLAVIIKNHKWKPGLD